MTKSNRYFCVVSIKSGTKEINLVRKLKSNNCIGRYKGSSPVIAAKKVASRVFREVKGVSRKVLEIKIHENTSKIWARSYKGKSFDSGAKVKEELRNSNPAGMQGYVFNTRKSLFSDFRVRKAIYLAMDFEWMNRQQIGRAHV